MGEMDDIYYFNRAMIERNLEKAGSYLKKGVDINAQDRTGKTTLMDVIRHSGYGYKFLFFKEYFNDKSLKFLLSNGADVHIKDNSQKTALHYACDSGCAHCVKLLLEYGADVNVQDKNGRTPMMVLLRTTIEGMKVTENWPYMDDACEILRIFIDKGADIGLKNAKGLTFEQIAIKNKKNRLLEIYYKALKNNPKLC